MKDNAWFVGFAPRDNPEIVVAALFENGEHGQLAAPIVRDVMKAYFDKKARLAQPQPQLARVPTDLLQAPPVAAARVYSGAVRISNMPAHRSIRDFDWLMLILVCAICALGRASNFQRHRRNPLRRSLVETSGLDPRRLRRACGSRR